MTAIVAPWVRQTLSIARPGPGQALPGEFSLRDGTPALIWPLLPTDAEMLRAGFRGLSRESRQRRFLTAIDELDDSMIRRLVDSVDGLRHIALVLTVLPPEGKEGPVGVGTALVAALMERRPAAITRLCTLVDADNRASLALLARAGRMSSGPAHLGIRDVTVELPAASQARRAAERAADFWTQGARKLIDQTHSLLRLPQPSPFLVVERYFEFARRMLEMNRELTIKWVETASALSAKACAATRARPR